MFFYVYMHLDPRDETVRYVGVGPLSRAYDFQTRSVAHLAWIAELNKLELEPKVTLPSKTKDREEAFEVECALIAWHRKYGSPLLNVTNGGSGRKGVPLSAETKQRISEASKARWLFDEEFRARRLPDIAKARVARNRSAEHIAKITKHDKINGSPCKKCGGTLRYATKQVETASTVLRCTDVKRWLWKLAASHPPDFIIGGAENPYVRRWWVIPRNRFFNIYLHQFLRSDDDRALHDHPWINCSYILLGEYTEWTIAAGGVHKSRVAKQGSVKFRGPRFAHRVELHAGSCWSLFITGPVVRNWGFHCTAGWRPWQIFVDKRDSGSIGRGCD